jgi:hypothetical protein
MFDIDDEGKSGAVRVAALGEAFLIERCELVDNVYVPRDSAIIPICEHPELADLYRPIGMWNLGELECLLCPNDDTDRNYLELTQFAREQLAALAV